jgi:hypothetical protein
MEEFFEEQASSLALTSRRRLARANPQINS